MTNKKVNYGQDVPSMVRDNLIIGAIIAAMGAFLRLWVSKRESPTTPLVSLLGRAAFLVSGLSILDGLAIVWSSRVSKLWIRDRLLDGLRLRGDETLLDVGCGHGVLLVGAAKRLPRGKAVGIDLWSQIDQGDNSKAATLANAEAEGVLDRVAVCDGDMRELPFPTSTFDVAVASLAIHNIESDQGRSQAVREIARVLKPGGRVAIMDIFAVEQIAGFLRQHGIQDVGVSGPDFLHYPPARIIRGRKSSAQHCAETI